MINLIRRKFNYVRRLQSRHSVIAQHRYAYTCDGDEYRLASPHGDTLIAQAGTKDHLIKNIDVDVWGVIRVIDVNRRATKHTKWFWQAQLSGNLI